MYRVHTRQYILILHIMTSWLTRYYLYKGFDNVQTPVCTSAVKWVDERFVEVVYIRSVFYLEVAGKLIPEPFNPVGIKYCALQLNWLLCTYGSQNLGRKKSVYFTRHCAVEQYGACPLFHTKNVALLEAMSVVVSKSSVPQKKQQAFKSKEGRTKHHSNIWSPE